MPQSLPAISGDRRSSPTSVAPSAPFLRCLQPPHPLELLLDGLALVVTDGRATATPVLQRAAKAVAEMPVEDVLRWGWIAPAASASTWDADRYGAIFERQAQLVRDGGALAELPQHLTGLAWYRAFIGDLAGARLLVGEIDMSQRRPGRRFRRSRPEASIAARTGSRRLRP